MRACVDLSKATSVFRKDVFPPQGQMRSLQQLVAQGLGQHLNKHLEDNGNWRDELTPVRIICKYISILLYLLSYTLLDASNDASASFAVYEWMLDGDGVVMNEAFSYSP